MLPSVLICFKGIKTALWAIFYTTPTKTKGLEFEDTVSGSKTQKVSEN